MALQTIEKALSISERIHYATGMANGHFAEGNVYFQKKNYVTALACLEKARPLYIASGNEELLARLYKMMADCYAGRSYYRQAFDYYREANPLLRKTNQLELYGQSLEATGNLVLNFGVPKNALGFYRRSLLTRENLRDTAGIVFCNTMISKIFFSEKNYDSALFFNRAAAQLAKNNSEAIVDAAIEELIILTFLKKIDEAEKAKHDAEKLVAFQNDETNKIRLLGAIANLYLVQNDKANSKKYFDSAKAKITGTQNVALGISGLAQIAEIHSHNGDYKAAYEALKSMDKYKDVLRNEHIDKASAEINKAAEISLREKEISYLNLLNKLKQAQLDQEELKRLGLLRQNILKDSSLASQRLLMADVETQSAISNQQLQKEKELSLSLGRENGLKEKLLNDEQRNKKILWAGIIAMAVLGGIIFYQYSRQKRKNCIINKQSAELETLNKEIHHRVKNNLQVISSMLDLQSQTLNDAKATAIIKEGIQRVQSMAFIHQNLYQGNAVNSVNMNEYIRTLSGHLFQTYNIRTDKIQLHTQIENLGLHTDTAIPLGMILNELISNALKYAFTNRENGDIWVTMKRNSNELLLQVKDNGNGLPAGFDPGNTSSFGYSIIQAFLQKLKARMNIDGSNGTDVQIIISKFKTIT